MITLDRVRGMLIGACVGDALGAPHELRHNQGNKYLGYICHRQIIGSAYGHPPTTIALGQMTDDSEMTIIRMRSLVQYKGYNVDDVLMQDIAWANSGTKALGRNTRERYKGIKTRSGYERRYAKDFRSDNKSEWTQSDGALMRCSPLALLPGKYTPAPSGISIPTISVSPSSETKVILPSVSDPVAIDCALTNPAEVCIDCNQVYITILRSIIRGNTDRKSLIATASSLASTESVKNVIAVVGEMKEVPTSSYNEKWPKITGKSKGWCLNGLYCTLICLTHFTTYEACMSWVIQHPNSDADTNACIAGAVMGAFFGYEALNKEKLTAYNIHMVRTCDTTTGQMPRHPMYGLSDFDILTEAATKVVNELR